MPDDVFLVPGDGKRPKPTDMISQDSWNGIVHLPDDVALTTSGHHGRQLNALYTLWADWITATGDDQDALFVPMLDAGDCFQSCTFDALHGYYRSALANLRSALELVAIGALGMFAPADEAYLRWKQSDEGSSLTFPSCYKRLQGTSQVPLGRLLKEQRGWIERFYYKLCDYAHSRPDSSDGEMWKSNGPIYVGHVMNDVFRLEVSTYATCYILATLGRKTLLVPKDSAFIFETPEILWCEAIIPAYNAARATVTE